MYLFLNYLVSGPCFGGSILQAAESSGEVLNPFHSHCILQNQNSKGQVFISTLNFHLSKCWCQLHLSLSVMYAQAKHSRKWECVFLTWSFCFNMNACFREGSCFQNASQVSHFFHVNNPDVAQWLPLSDKAYTSAALSPTRVAEDWSSPRAERVKSIES